MNILKKIENMKDTKFKILIVSLYILAIGLFCIFICIIQLIDMSILIELTVLIFLSLIIGIIIFTTIAFIRLKQFAKRSRKFLNIDKYFFEKEYELILELLKNQNNILPQIVYFFFISLVSVSVFFFNLQNNKDSLLNKIESILNEPLWYSIMLTIWMAFFLILFILYYNEKLYLFYLEKLQETYKANKNFIAIPKNKIRNSKVNRTSSRFNF